MMSLISRMIRETCQFPSIQTIHPFVFQPRNNAIYHLGTSTNVKPNYTTDVQYFRRSLRWQACDRCQRAHTCTNTAFIAVM